MGKNGGGQPADTILTLEEALMRFKRKEDEGGEQIGSEAGSEGNVHYVNFSATVEREDVGRATGYLESADEGASVSAQRDEPNAGMSADGDFVAVIDGIPRTFEKLERIAAAEKA
jgi:hypothetical protein